MARTRYSSVIALLPDKRAEYLDLHAAVWPAVESMISACNIRNYSIFVHGDLLVSYYEYTGTDHAADLARMAADPATQRWWALTNPCQQRLPDTPDGEQWLRLPEVWHLD
jgi:L-rhamnose mutarotase